MQSGFGIPIVAGILVIALVAPTPVRARTGARSALLKSSKLLNRRTLTERQRLRAADALYEALFTGNAEEQDQAKGYLRELWLGRELTASVSLKGLYADLKGFGPRREVRGIVLTFSGPRAFLPGKTRLRRAAYRRLKRIAAILKRYPDVRILVEGHSDPKEVPADDLRLSEKRAGRIRNYLSRSGLPHSAVRSLGYGGKRPGRSSFSRRGHSSARRVELRILPKRNRGLLSIGRGLRARGEVGLESRIFEGDRNGATEDFNLSGLGRLELSHRHRNFRQQLRLFGRIGAFDPDRNRFNIEEFWTGYRLKGWKIRLGSQLLDWTATEAFHPADIINSRNLDSNIENAAKIGEPMLAVSRRIGTGSLSAYYMPYRVPPQTPSGSSRLSLTGPGFDVGGVYWAEDDGKLAQGPFSNQWAVRLTRTVGDADLSLHLVQHHDRSQPIFLFDPSDGKLHPIFLPVTQIGGTYLHILGPWVIKLEAAWRDFKTLASPSRLGRLALEDHGQAAFGLDFGWDHVGGSQSTVFLEGQGIAGTDKATRAGLHLFQQDLLVGYRLSLNDTLAKELLATFIIDMERSNEYIANVNYSQRLSDTLSLKSGLRWIHAPQKSASVTGLEALDGANQLFLTFSKHF